MCGDATFEKQTRSCGDRRVVTQPRRGFLFSRVERFWKPGTVAWKPGQEHVKLKSPVSGWRKMSPTGRPHFRRVLAKCGFEVSEL